MMKDDFSFRSNHQSFYFSFEFSLSTDFNVTVVLGLPEDKTLLDDQENLSSGKSH